MTNEQDERDDQQQSGDFGSDPDVPIIHLPPPEHPHHATKETHYRHHYIKRGIEVIRKRWPTATQLTAFASIIAAGATTVYAIYAYHQWQAMVASSEQTERAIRAANRTAQAAEDSLHEARDSARKAERPYMALNLGMSPAQGEIRTPGNVGTWLNYNGKMVEWSIHFKNFGKSPAVNVRANGYVALGSNAWRNVTWRQIDKVTGNVVPPEGDEWITARSREVSPQDYKVFHDTFGNIAVFGHIEYEGLDGTNYWTEYCFSHGEGGAIEVCPTHNLGN